MVQAILEFVRLLARGVLMVMGPHRRKTRSKAPACLIQLAARQIRVQRLGHGAWALAAMVVFISCARGGSGATRGTPMLPRSTSLPASTTREPLAPNTNTTMPHVPATSVRTLDEPVGFPMDPGTRLGQVVGNIGRRRIDSDVGPRLDRYVQDDETSAEPSRANASGWGCRVHMEYEGQPAFDAYVPSGTPVKATLDGTASLFAITTSNAFDVYGVDREPFIGNPDRSRALVAPFPGPGGGKGVFVRIENERYRVEYGHLDLAPTMRNVAADAFLVDIGHNSDLLARFSTLRDARDATILARWDVRRGDLIGFSGDSGYSEAPHLHYAITRLRDNVALCPTAEAGFADGGWLLAH